MRVGTHDGSFHADEAFAVAALRLAAGSVEVVRTRDPERLAACDLRVDVGMRHDPAAGDFDHHQPGGAGQRASGIPYASFGLVWQHFGESICGGDPDVAHRVDERLVQGIDAHDTGKSLTPPVFDGVQPMTVSGMIAALNPLWDEESSPEQVDARFAEAVDLAERVLEREVAAAAARSRASSLVHAAIRGSEDPRVVELDTNMPWHEAVVSRAPEALFVVYPKTDGWGVQAVPRHLGTFGNRKDLPSAWAGRSGDELVAVTGVPDAVFCHSGRFMAVARSREGIRALVEQALAVSEGPD